MCDIVLWFENGDSLPLKVVKVSEEEVNRFYLRQTYPGKRESGLVDQVEFVIDSPKETFLV